MSTFVLSIIALAAFDQPVLEPVMPFVWIDPTGGSIVFKAESLSFEHAGGVHYVERCGAGRCLDGGGFVIYLPYHNQDAEIKIEHRMVRSKCGAFAPIWLLGRKFNARWCQTYLQGDLVANLLHDDVAGIIMLAFRDGEEWVSGVAARLPGIWGTGKFGKDVRPISPQE